jgi:endonuclease/exonuclease/phosphatase family metal-dependent hydrolase
VISCTNTYRTERTDLQREDCESASNTPLRLVNTPLRPGSNSFFPPPALYPNPTTTTTAPSMSSGSDDGGRTFRVVSYNCWGIFNSKYKDERLRHLATKIRQFDVVCLQELFSEADYLLLKGLLGGSDEFYSRRFPSSFIGSGLAVFSKHEIISSDFMTYPCQGFPEKIYHGDFFANKGVALCRLRMRSFSPQGVSLDGTGTSSNSFYATPKLHSPDDGYDVLIYNTHLVAQYEKYSKLGSYDKETYAGYRLSQAHSIAKFVVATSRPHDNVVVCGDFNSDPHSPEVRLFLAQCAVHGLDMSKVLIPDDSTNYTYTIENLFNAPAGCTYLAVMDMQEDMPVQLDHIFFTGKHLSLRPFRANQGDVSAHHAKHNDEGTIGVVLFTNNREVNTKDGKLVPMSDHFGVGARFFRGDTFSAPAPLTQLQTDPTTYRKSLEFGSSFLLRSSLALKRSQRILFGTALLFVLLPFVLAFLIDCHDTSLFSILRHNVITAMLTTVAVVSFFIGKLHRGNDSIVMLAQGDELARLLL